MSCSRDDRRDHPRNTGRQRHGLRQAARPELQHPRHRRAGKFRRRRPHHRQCRRGAEILRAVPHGLVLLRSRTLQARRGAARPGLSTLYGSGALGGVINFETKDASDFIADGENGALRLKGSWNSNGDGYLVSTVLAQRMGENAEFLLTGNYRASDPYDIRRRRRGNRHQFQGLVGPRQGHFQRRRRGQVAALLPAVGFRPRRPATVADQHGDLLRPDRPPRHRPHGYRVLRESVLRQRHARREGVGVLLRHVERTAQRRSARRMQPRHVRGRLRLRLRLRDVAVQRAEHHGVGRRQLGRTT